ncbi:MAG: hypothetical protein QOH06_3165 [Acidobacteriota bacterium]|jgi:hypothetical protein|nr:hypothetical protein [Acidobacteriota bacterium]
MWSRRRLLALIWFVLACGRPGFAQEAPVRLLAPQPGARLAAGSMAELEWAPLAELDRRVEEWEAFLSLDGGVTYPVRITPHLDQDVRRIRWQVPPFPAEDVRILLRFGDERRETAVELATRFSIAESPGGLPLPASRSATRGEPALPGHPGVVAWVEGSRRGGALRQRIAAEPARLKPAFALPTTHTEAAEASLLGPDSTPPGTAASSPPVPPDSRWTAGMRAGASPAFVSDILLLIQRQNE